MNDINLPDSFVERVKTLEINYETLQREHSSLSDDFKRIKVETKRSRLFWHFLDRLPVSPEVTLSVLTGFTFIVSLFAEVTIRLTIIK
jgi:hypothetical protein